MLRYLKLTKYIMIYNNWYFKDLSPNEKEKLKKNTHAFPSKKRKFDNERLKLQSKALEKIPNDAKVGIKALSERMKKANKETEVFTREEFLDLIQSQKLKTKKKIEAASVPLLLFFFNIHFGGAHVTYDKEQKKFITSSEQALATYQEDKDSFTVTYNHFPESTLTEFCVLSVLESKAQNKVTAKLLEKLKEEEEGSYALIKRRGEFGEELPFLLLIYKYGQIVRYNLKINDQGLATLTARNIGHEVYSQKDPLKIKYGPDQLITVLTELGCKKNPVTSEDV